LKKQKCRSPIVEREGEIERKKLYFHDLCNNGDRERHRDRNWKPQQRGGDNNRNNGYDGGDTR